MAIYIAFLRGINVGGNNRIKMAELKQMFEGLGLSKVQTYIQSGNVLFTSAEEEEALRTRIEQEIERVFKFSVSVVMRKAAEIQHMILNCPFTAEAIAEAEAVGEGESLYVTLLHTAPSQERIDRWSVYKSDKDSYKIIGRDVFLLFKHSIRDSKLSVNLQKLGVTATVRNWKTIHKLVELANAMED